MEDERSSRRLTSYYAAFVGLGLTAACVGPTLPSLAAAAGVSLAQIGLVILTRALGGMVGSLLTGPALDHGKGRTAVTIAILIMLGCMAIVPFSRSLAPFLAVFLVLGAAQGALNTGANTLLIWMHPRRAHSNLSILHFSYGFGSLLAPLLVAWLLPVRSDGLFVYWFLAITLVPLVFWIGRSVRPTPPSARQAVSVQPSSKQAFLWVLLLFFLFVGAETTVGGWLFSFAERAAQLSPTAAAYLTSTFWGTFTGGRLLAVLGSVRIRPARYVRGSILASIASSIGVLVFSHGGVGLWVCVAALGLSLAAVFPQAFAFAGTVVRLTGRRTSWILVASSLGGMLIPWAAGQLLESISANTLPTVVGIVMGLALVSFSIVTRITSRNTDALSAQPH